MDAVFNTIIDNALIAGQRVLDIPLIILAPALLVCFIAVTVIIRTLKKREGKRTLLLFLKWLRIVLVVVVAALLIDYKVIRLVKEVRDLRSGARTNLSGLFDLMAVNRDSFLVDLDRAERELTESFGKVRMLPLIYDEAADVVFLRLEEPLTRLYLAVVDLADPRLAVTVNSEMPYKWPVSIFGRLNNSLVAINGEAGISPAKRAKLGEWTGNLVCRGEPVLMEDTEKRPFLSFDRANRPRYYPQKIVDRTVTPDKYNTIWGRVDILVGDEIPDLNTRSRWRDRHPRTAMAVSGDGDRLFLLVADGRQPGFSMGLTAEEMAIVMKAFGASDGMVCDGGGSSAIYLGKFGGIVNSPSDGFERGTYTHFGITRQ